MRKIVKYTSSSKSVSMAFFTKAVYYTNNPKTIIPPEEIRALVEAEALLNTDGETLLNTDGSTLFNTGAS